MVPFGPLTSTLSTLPPALVSTSASSQNLPPFSGCCSTVLFGCPLVARWLIWAQDSRLIVMSYDHSNRVLKCKDHGVDKKEENIGLKLETMETIGGILVNFPAKSGEGKINKDKALQKLAQARSPLPAHYNWGAWSSHKSRR